MFERKFTGAQTKGGKEKGKRASERAQKNTIHCGNVFNIHLHAAHTHTANLVSQKGPALYVHICDIYVYI